MPGTERNPQTLYDKVLSNHIVDEKLDGTVLLYIGMFFASEDLIYLEVATDSCVV